MTGWSLPEILEGYDFEEFNQLFETLIKLEAREKMESAYTAFITSQCPGDAMKKWIRHWEKVAGLESRTESGGLKDFMKAIGGKKRV